MALAMHTYRQELDRDDWDSYQALRTGLLDQFFTWLRNDLRFRFDEEAADRYAGLAGLALDFKFSQSDPHLTRWRDVEVHQFLTHWCPRQLSVDPGTIDLVPAAITAYFAFLDATELAVPSEPGDVALADVVDLYTSDYHDAMADITGSGVTMTLFEAMPSNVRPTTEQAVDQIFDGDPRTTRSRAAILGSPLTLTDLGAPPEPERSPQIEAPTEPGARGSAGQSLLLRQLRVLVDFYGDGRKVTQKGNITLTDARALLLQLESTDHIVRLLSDPSFRLKSSADLPILTSLVEVAKAADLLQQVKTKLVPTERTATFGDDVLSDFAVAFDAVLQLGPAALARLDERPFGTDLAPVFDQLAEPVISLLVSRPVGDGLPFDQLVEVALDQFQSSALNDVSWTEAFRQRIVRGELRAVLETLERLGAVRWDGWMLVDGDSAEDRHGGIVHLSAAGRYRAADLARSAGAEVVLPEPIVAPFDDLVMATEATDFTSFQPEAEAWLAGRSDARAATDLVDAAMRTADPAVCELATATLSLVERTIAERAARRLLDDDGTRSWGLSWLVDQGCESPARLLACEPDVMVDVLAMRIADGDDDRCNAALSLAGEAGDQIALVANLWRVASPATGTVLDHVGRHHPDKRVAKAARKAAVQHRSFAANGR